MEKKHIDILIIEDSPADRKLAELMLQESTVPSFGIRYAVRLEEARKMLETEPFDIILMDLDLPDSSGLDGLRKITDRPGSPPVVVLTGLEDEAMGLEALEKGASDFLVKGRLTLNSLIRSLLYALTRREMEQKLLDEQRNLQAIFDAANVGMILIDETSAVQRINRVIQQWTGKGAPTAYGVQPGNILGCIHALSDSAGCGHTLRCQACPMRKIFESVLHAGQPLHDIEMEMTLMIGSDQAHLHLAVSADPLVLNGKRHVILALNNITARKQAEDALRRSREDLDRAQAVGQIGSWRLDIGRNILTWSVENHFIFGVPEGTPMTYETFLGIVHPEDRQYVDDRWKACLNGEPYDIEHRIVVDGVVKWIRAKAYLEYDAAGKLLGGFGISQDISERKQIEEALRASQERLALAAGGTGIGMFDWDIATGEAVGTEQLLRMIGLPVTKTTTTTAISFQYYYRDWAKAIHPEDMPHVENEIRRCKTGRVPFNIEYRVVWPNGSEHWLAVRGVFRCDTYGEPQHMLGIAFDITDRKHVEEILKRDVETFERIAQERTAELWEAQLKLAQSKRLSDIGALAATVAHELRTPLGVIRIGAYNMKRKTEDPALLKHISHIETKVIEADKIISNLLLYSRIKMPSMEEVRLYDLLKECVDHAVENLKDHPVRILSQFDPIQNESVKLDPLQIKEVFHNILANAVDALANRKDGQIKVSALRYGPKKEISITFEDNGIGISEPDLKRIHEPFFTTKSKGTGLGLTVCTQIIHNHGGRIEVASQIGQGSVFTVILPVREGMIG